MLDIHLYASLPAADGQPAVFTTHSASYQPAVTGAAEAVEGWLKAPFEQPLLDLFHGWIERIPCRVREPFRDAFLLRLEQHLRACHASLSQVPPAPTSEQEQPAESDDA
ncbi:hypothetical protein FA469_24080 [Pseudomonas aeruginosa]|uniref:hypothetical protein n=1 Tax=Pseudomonas aeruginosa TaxID=287 RepID=UPI000AC68BD6|nr:hypothetical protein [Pseudomonas aeruginosa]MCO1752429.1 hypothetical protein [Pseudomonas aeruginosa]RTW10510.1 hypothetical protein DZA01_29580 [Pseudomonas aeruginosa]HCE5725376.1 hypothetical protein [Pseudomonas aeruginosa]HCF3653853.1 hypothetical protein [Pseudomonas aeruginosa]HCJ0869880.1 hypothetical protein [Pseudomonas aeruginosa]